MKCFCELRNDFDSVTYLKINFIKFLLIMVAFVILQFIIFLLMYANCNNKLLNSGNEKLMRIAIENREENVQMCYGNEN